MKAIMPLTVSHPPLPFTNPLLNISFVSSRSVTRMPQKTPGVKYIWRIGLLFQNMYQTESVEEVQNIFPFFTALSKACMQAHMHSYRFHHSANINKEPSL